jgi:hypothetical protein
LGPPAAIGITRDQTGEGSLVGLGLEGMSDQAADGAGRQPELASDLGRGGPEAGHPGDGQTQGQFGGAWHRG